MASPYYNKFMDETLGSDPNGNQKTWQNQTTPGFQPMGWGVQPINPRPWEKQWGNAIGSFFSGLVPQQQPMSVFPEFIPQGNQPPQGIFGGVPYGPKQPVVPINPFDKSYNRTQPTLEIMNRAAPMTSQQKQGFGYSAMRNQLSPTPQTQQSKGYAQMRAEANMTPQQKQNQAYGQMRTAASGPNPKNGALFQASKNPLFIQAQAAAQKSFWTNAYQQLNAALRPVSLPTTPNAGTGGYDYGGYGYGYGGGGGYSRSKYAENLPGAVWRINQ